MFVRPLGWQWAGQVTMLGLSQLHAWWLMEGSCGVEIPDGSAPPAQRCAEKPKCFPFIFHHHTRAVSPQLPARLLLLWPPCTALTAWSWQG